MKKQDRGAGGREGGGGLAKRGVLGQFVNLKGRGAWQERGSGVFEGEGLICQRTLYKKRH